MGSRRALTGPGGRSVGRTARETGPRVLQVVTSTDRRGAEVFAFELGEVLTHRGLNVRTVALGEGRSGARLPVDALGPPRVGTTALRRLRAELDHASVLIAHGSTTLPYCALATVGKRTRFVYRSIGDPRFWSSTRARRLRTQLFLHRADALVALWPAAANDFQSRFGVPSDRLRVIPNGVSAARFEPASPAYRSKCRSELGVPLDQPVILYLGALSPEKDVGVAVTAVAGLPAGHLLVVGDGAERATLEEQATRTAPGRVHFTGAVSDPSTALSAADVVVLPSKTEGVPAVAIEAGLCGLPVVATDVGGVSEVVRHGETGFLFRPGDAAGMTVLLHEAILQGGDLGPRARAWCLPRFGIEQVADAWMQLLAALGDPSEPVTPRGPCDPRASPVRGQESFRRARRRPG